ncbi:MAG TPA: carbonic anhydrase [Solirubrobacterales bacterium]|nr:carbonic anhydrase [Solirubrobacterales bacterium]
MAWDDTLLERNRAYAERGVGELPPLPRRGLVVLTCMDHRIDPIAALGLELGDAMVLRNPGGRVTPELINDLETLDRVARARGSDLAALELVLMQHTECGANALTSTDPHEGVRRDIEGLAAHTAIPDSFSVTGLVYETATGRVQLLERRSPLR